MAKKASKSASKAASGKKPNKKGTTVAEIEKSLAADGAAFYAAFRKRKSKETVYSFLFELSDVGYYAAAAIATEEELARYIQESLDSFDEDDALERAIAEWRWAGPEDGWHQSTDKQFQATNDLLELAEESELYPEYSGTLETIALAALKQMIADGVFGSDEERKKIVIGICHTGGDNPEKLFVSWASEVNSPAVIRRLKAELKRSRDIRRGL